MIDITNSSTTCAIGLDVGGTKIAGGIVLPSGQNLNRKIIPTEPERGGGAVLTDALGLAEELMTNAQNSGLTVLGIGIGVAELVDLDGNVTSSNLIAWQDLSVQDYFARLAPAIVESDVRAPALAEALYGAGQAFDIFTYISVGTGISYCLMVNGRPYAGAQGNALILASSPLTSKCAHCGRVSAPILEEEAAGPGLVRRYNEKLKLDPGDNQKRSPSKGGEDVLVAVEAGDPLAVEVVSSAGEMLGVSVGWLVNVLDPEAVIVGGGLGSADGLYWDSFVASTRRHIWSDTNRDLPIIHAGLGTDAGFIGAAATVFQRQQRGEETK
jgi:glucokinase